MEWDRILSPVRLRPDSSLVPSDSLDLRTEFQRDYSKAIFSTPVRRLQDKAQVFPLEPNDSVRTRLTHSLEVSGLAQDIAGAVAEWLCTQGEISYEQSQSVRDIAKTAGLVHDIGNPPFGHAGERAISTWFVDHRQHELARLDEYGSSQLREDFLQFDGNAQTFRLLTHLSVLLDFHGYNFTVGTLSAAMKYLAPSHQPRPQHEYHKAGFFATENDVVERVREITRTGGARNPVTYLIEAADDIVNATVDLEDAVRKGVLNWERVCHELRSASGQDSEVEEIVFESEKRVALSPVKLSPRLREEVLIQVLRSRIIHRAVPAVVNTFKKRYDDIKEGRYSGELTQDPAFGSLVTACKSAAKIAYSTQGVLELESMGRKVIHDLLDLFWEAVEDREDGKSFGFKVYQLTSENYRAVFSHCMCSGGLPELYCKMRFVNDYVAGMTDSFARDLHRRLMNG